MRGLWYDKDMTKTTQTSQSMNRTEMIELLAALNVTTTLVRLAESREDGKGVCGAFTVKTDHGRFWLAIETA